MNKHHILWVVVIVIIIALAVWLWPAKNTVEAPEISEVETPDVAPSTDVLDNVTPANPLEKTNPFNY